MKTKTTTTVAPTTPTTTPTAAKSAVRTKGEWVIEIRDEAGVRWVGYGKGWETKKLASIQTYKVKENAERWIAKPEQQARKYSETAKVISREGVSPK